MVGQVARVDPTTVGFGAPAADRQAETDPGSVCATLLEWLEQVVDVAVGQPATFVLDFNQHTVGGRAPAQGDDRTGARELEGILEEIRHGRRQNRSVRVDVHPRVSLLHVQ